MKTPESFLDVRSYSKEILDEINSDGDQECQETIEIWTTINWYLSLIIILRVQENTAHLESVTFYLLDSK